METKSVPKLSRHKELECEFCWLGKHQRSHICVAIKKSSICHSVGILMFGTLVEISLKLVIDIL